jgi:hypothetical protein
MDMALGRCYVPAVGLNIPLMEVKITLIWLDEIIPDMLWVSIHDLYMIVCNAPGKACNP